MNILYYFYRHTLFFRSKFHANIFCFPVRIHLMLALESRQQCAATRFPKIYLNIGVATSYMDTIVTYDTCDLHKQSAKNIHSTLYPGYFETILGNIKMTLYGYFYKCYSRYLWYKPKCQYILLPFFLHLRQSWLEN